MLKNDCRPIFIDTSPLETRSPRILVRTIYRLVEQRLRSDGTYRAGIKAHIDRLVLHAIEETKTNSDGTLSLLVFE
jgi:hypothetical protein